MATEKNITMKQFNGTDYDTLYPKTKVEQVEDAYSQQQILADSTKALYVLGNDAVPDDVFKSLSDCFAQILVSTVPNTEVTASLNGKTVSATSDSSGLAILKIPGYGTWTISVTAFGRTVSKNCEIKAIAQYELALFTDLETVSWDDISSVSESGNAASVWSVGDTKTVNFNGVDYQAQIIGFDHDTKTSGGKAGITFQFVKSVKTTYKMNNSSTNVGGWKSCNMRTSTMPALLAKLPSELQNVIKDVNKLTSAGNSSATIDTTSDKLFLLSEVEVFGSATNSVSGEGTQYVYYKAGNSASNGGFWWERSPVKNSSTEFCYVDNAGRPDINVAKGIMGVSFAFCV